MYPLSLERGFKDGGCKDARGLGSKETRGLRELAVMRLGECRTRCTYIPWECIVRRREGVMEGKRVAER